jgi:pantothenate synthetase
MIGPHDIQQDKLIQRITQNLVIYIAIIHITILTQYLDKI